MLRQSALPVCSASECDAFARSAQIGEAFMQVWFCGERTSRPFVLPWGKGGCSARGPYDRDMLFGTAAVSATSCSVMKPSVAKVARLRPIVVRCGAPLPPFSEVPCGRVIPTVVGTGTHRLRLRRCPSQSPPGPSRRAYGSEPRIKPAPPVRTWPTQKPPTASSTTSASATIRSVPAASKPPATAARRVSEQYGYLRNASDVTVAPTVLADAPGRIGRFAAGRGYDANWLRAELRSKGITSVILGTRPQAPYPAR